jgi:hypothetical protein
MSESIGEDFDVISRNLFPADSREDIDFHLESLDSIIEETEKKPRYIQDQPYEESSLPPVSSMKNKKRSVYKSLSPEMYTNLKH